MELRGFFGSDMGQDIKSPLQVDHIPESKQTAAVEHIDVNTEREIPTGS